MYFDRELPSAERWSDPIPKPVKTILSCKPKTDISSKSLTLRELVKQVAEMDSKDGYLQSNFVIEECAELIIEMARTYRPDRTTNEKMFDEACDVLATTFVLLYSLGYNDDEVRDRIKLKYLHALEEVSINEIYRNPNT